MVFSGCASFIPGTKVKDTDENRAVYDTIIALREGLQAKDAEKVLGMVSKTYFENMGTPSPKDDFGYERLAKEILPKTLEKTSEFYLNFELHDIMVEGDSAVADVRYASRARIDMPSGEVWDTHREFNRLEFVRESGRWMVTAGL